MTKIIKLISIDKKLKKYLEDFQVNSLEKFSIEEGNKFFVKIINDFKDAELTLDELSIFGENIFHKIAKKYPKSELFQASLCASELNFAVRSEAVFENIPMYLKEVEEFYNKFN